MKLRITTACAFLLLLVLGCTEKKGDSFMRFTVEDKQYQVNNVEFSYLTFPQHPKYQSFTIGQNITESSKNTPNGRMLWIMESSGIGDLQEKEIDFSKIQAEAKKNSFLEPLALFTLDNKEITVAPCATSVMNNMVIKIDRLDGQYVEGSFSAPDYCYLSAPEKISRPVKIEGIFHAKLNVLAANK